MDPESLSSPSSRSASSLPSTSASETESPGILSGNFVTQPHRLSDQNVQRDNLPQLGSRISPYTHARISLLSSFTNTESATSVSDFLLTAESTSASETSAAFSGLMLAEEPRNRNVKADNSGLKNISTDERAPHQNVTADTDNLSGLENLLADELVRRRKFSHKLLQYFNSSALEGASSGQLMMELQKLDVVIATLIEQCRSPPLDVSKRDKGEHSARNVDSGIVNSAEDFRRHGVRFSNTPTAEGFADLGSTFSAVSEIEGM